MMHSGIRWPGSMLLALVCAAMLGATSLLSPAFVAAVEKVLAEIRLLADDGFGLIMGGTGNPTPDTPYFDAMLSGYLGKLFPAIPAGTADWHALPTPEQFCPIVCVPVGAAPGGVPPFPLPAPLDPADYPPNLTFGSSVFTGAGIMNQAIRTDGIPVLDAGNPVVVSGYSQSGTVATASLNDLLAMAHANGGAGTPGWPTLSELKNLHYELHGDPNTPLGGILDRFQFPDGIEKFSLTPAMQHVPFLNIPLGIAPTPTSDLGTSDIITGEYDGWANFPQDPVTGLLADLNAIIGIETVHPFYPAYSGVIGESGQLASAVSIGTVGNTDMWMIPENLPILQFMYNGSSTAGQFFGDFFSPWARLVIDWAYGNAGDPGDNLTGTLGVDTAGGSGVNGMYLISPDEVTNGANIAGSPYQATVGVAGGPWEATPYGDLYQSTLSDTAPFLGTNIADSGVAGIFMKMDPLQMLAGVQNALIQSIVGPWADVASGNSATIPPDVLAVVNEITQALRFVTGYDLVNGLDQLLLGGLKDLGLEDVINGLFDGPLIPGQPIIDLVGVGFDVVNFFGA